MTFLLPPFFTDEMSDDCGTSTSRWRPTSTSSFLPRRHSITVAQLQPAGGNGSGNATQQQAGYPRSGRRQSIQESLHSITKSVSTSLQKAMHITGGSTASLQESRLTKAFFRDVLSVHFRQPDLKVIEFFIYFCVECFYVTCLRSAGAEKHSRGLFVCPLQTIWRRTNERTDFPSFIKQLSAYIVTNREYFRRTFFLDFHLSFFAFRRP